jgi:hypothetical protein
MLRMPAQHRARNALRFIRTLRVDGRPTEAQGAVV